MHSGGKLADDCRCAQRMRNVPSSMLRWFANIDIKVFRFFYVMAYFTR